MQCAKPKGGCGGLSNKGGCGKPEQAGEKGGKVAGEGRGRLSRLPKA